MSYLIARGLNGPPWLEVKEVINDVPTNDIALNPPLISPALKVRFAPDGSQMVSISDFRRNQIDGIGNPDDETPTAGIKLIAPNDAFILIGGSVSEDPAMYQRRGPGYQRWPMDAPVDEYYLAGAFSESARYFFAVMSDDDEELKFFRRGSSSFETIYTFDCGFAIRRIIVTFGEEYVIALGDSAYQVFQFLDSQVTPFPTVTATAGKLLAVSPDARWYIVDDGNAANELVIYEHEEGVWTEHTVDLVETTGTDRKAEFSPDGNVLIVSMAATGNKFSPCCFNVGDGTFQFTRGRFRTNSATREHRDAVFSSDSAWMMQAHTDNGGSTSLVELYEQVPYLPEIYEIADPLPLDTVPAMAQVQGMAFSPNGDYFAYCGNSSPWLVVYKNDGSGDFSRLMTLSDDPTNTVHGVTFSPDGNYLVICQSVAPSVMIYKRDGDNWNLLASPLNALPTQPYKAEFSADSNWLVFALNGTLNIAAYKRTGDSFSNVGVTINGGTAVSSANFPSFDMSPDASACIIGGQRGAGSGTHWAIWRRSGDTWTRVTRSGVAANIKVPGVALTNDGAIAIIATNTTSDSGGDVSMRVWNSGTSSYDLVNIGDHFNESLVAGNYSAVFFNSDSSLLFIVSSLTENMRVYFRDGDQFFRQEGIEADVNRSTTSGFDSNVISPDDRYIACGGSTATLQILTEVVPDPENPILTYQFVKDSSYSGVFPDLWGFYPDGSVAHFGSSVGRHRLTSDLDEQVAELSFDDENDPADITEVLWSKSGKFVLYVNPDGLSVSVRTEGSEGFTMSKKLNGRFVSKYIREGDNLIETEFHQLGLDAEITNLKYSKTGLAFSFFVLDPTGVSGRYIFDSDGEKFDIKGIDWTVGMEASYIAFSPWETHFAVAYQMAGGAHELRLFSFGTNRVFNYRDTAMLNKFGPVDMSYCDEVIVAGGGLTDPFELFEIVEMELVPGTFPITNWDKEGFIFGVLWQEDCEGIYVINPDEIIVIRDDEITDESPLPTPITDPEEGDLEEGDDDGPVIRNPAWPPPGGDGGGGGGGGGGWRPGGPGDPGIINPIGYQRYSTTHVTFWR